MGHFKTCIEIKEPLISGMSNPGFTVFRNYNLALNIDDLTCGELKMHFFINLC